MLGNTTSHSQTMLNAIQSSLQRPKRNSRSEHTCYLSKSTALLLDYPHILSQVGYNYLYASFRCCKSIGDLDTGPLAHRHLYPSPGGSDVRAARAESLV